MFILVYLEISSEDKKLWKNKIPIGSYVFQNCKLLTKISIPSSVTSIGDYAFQNCELLTEISIPSSVKSFGLTIFNGFISLYITGDMIVIGYQMSDKCTSLTQIINPPSVVEIINCVINTNNNSFVS